MSEVPPQGSVPPPPPPPGSGQGPHASGLPSDVRTWAALTHLSAFVGAWIFVAFVGPLVMWVLKRDEHPFLDAHGREALNFNLTVLAVGIGAAVLAIPVALLTLGLGLLVLVPFVIALVLWWLVLTVVAAVRAGDGQPYRYPATIRFVR